MLDVFALALVVVLTAVHLDCQVSKARTNASTVSTVILEMGWNTLELETTLARKVRPSAMDSLSFENASPLAAKLFRWQPPFMEHCLLVFAVFQVTPPFE